MEHLKIAQLSDLHLGRSFSSIANASAQNRIRDMLRSTFRNALRLITDREVDFLLICGDVFDRSEPLIQEASLFAAEISHFLEANPETHVIAIPGGHDHLGPASPYNTRPIIELKNHDRFYLFDTPGPSSISIAKKGITTAFHARPHTEKSSGTSPLSGLKPDSGADFNIALAHGGIADLIETMTDAESSRDPIRKEEIELFDYVALGDWHGFLAYPSSNNPKACYSGSLEPTSTEENPRPRGVLFIKIEKDTDTKVKVELENISQIRHVKKSVGSIAEVEKILKDYTDHQLVVFLRTKDDFLVDAIEDRLEQAKNVVYYSIESTASFSLPDLNSLPPTDLRSTIAEVAQAEIEDAELREEVLRTIFAGLEGYDV